MSVLPCTDQLQALYDAILALNTGERVIGINFGERSVQYSQNQLPDLLNLWRIFYRQCGADSGLVDLANTSVVLRGPPARIPR